MSTKRAAFLLNINEKEEIMVLSLSNNGLFIMPGGELKENETEIDAIVRELFESTGCNVNRNELMPIYSDFSNEDARYWATTFISFLELIPVESKKGVIPYFMEIKDFIGDSGYNKDYNIKLIEATIKSTKNSKKRK